MKILFVFMLLFFPSKVMAQENVMEALTQQCPNGIAIIQSNILYENAYKNKDSSQFLYARNEAMEERMCSVSSHVNQEVKDFSSLLYADSMLLSIDDKTTNPEDRLVMHKDILHIFEYLLHYGFGNDIKKLATDNYKEVEYFISEDMKEMNK